MNARLKVTKKSKASSLPEAVIRPVIEEVSPSVDAGRFPIKRVPGEEVRVRAVVHADSHDVLRAALLWRLEGSGNWKEAPMTCINPGLDTWEGVFQAGEPGRYEYAVEAWIDNGSGPRHKKIFPLVVEREKARFSAWYEMFPRSAGAAGKHATFREAESRLPDIAAMGFDILYLPPIHPISRSFRKGKNNSLISQPGDPGSPWAIGAAEGGHKAVHPELGTLKDFDHFLKEAESHGLEIALDIAFQCSPEHPYVKEHPEWFYRRPDGTIKYAENPPKKYQDIYPLHFECGNWRELWEELKSVVVFWARRGVRIFRVDNPHTKPYRFWEWMIAEVKKEFPDSIFLSEAFTRPYVMRYLAKCGFSQSYTYFTWRNEKWELEQYLTELAQPPAKEYFRPNFFANTPDILHEFLQKGGRSAFLIRSALASTLSPSWGVYSGFELCENEAVPDTEEYLNSEKYEIKVRDWDRPGHIKNWISKLNSVRRENPALQRLDNIRFLETDSDRILAYAKREPDKSNTLIIAVSLDPSQTQEAEVRVPEDLAKAPFKARDLFAGSVYDWNTRNFVRLTPEAPAHLLRVEGGA